MIFAAKSQPAPPCLGIEKEKASGTYRCDDVLHSIKKDFFNKCYICEQQQPTTINVEHFIPHKGDRDLEFDWDNLFYACGHCNNIKLAKAEFDNILNVTIKAHGVDEKIRYQINPYPKEKAVFQAIDDSPIVRNTIALLNSVYNGTTTLKTIEAANVRSLLLKEIRAFQDLLFKFYDESYSEEEREDKKKEIIRHLRCTSAFTAFKRWVIRDHENIRADFEQYCN